MNHILTVNYENKPAYDILLQADFSLLQEALETLDMANRRFMIITDSNVEKFYLRELKDIIQKCGKKVETFVFPAGEHSKNLNTVNDCYEKLIEAGFDRNDVLVALGGGVLEISPVLLLLLFTGNSICSNSYITFIHGRLQYWRKNGC